MTRFNLMDLQPFQRFLGLREKPLKRLKTLEHFSYHRAKAAVLMTKTNTDLVTVLTLHLYSKGFVDDFR